VSTASIKQLIEVGLFRQPPPLIYINEGSYVMSTASFKQLIEAGLLRQLPQLVYINRGDCF
jgi:hypothetical protein